MKEKEDFLKLLFPFRRKLFLEAFFKRLIQFQTAAAGGIFLLILLSRFVRLVHLSGYILFLFGSALCFSVAVVIFWDTITWEKTAAAGDRMGFSERLITAYGLLSKEKLNKMEMLVLKDAVALEKRNPPARLYKIKFSKRWIVSAAALLLSSVLCSVFLETPGQEVREKYMPALLSVEEIRRDMEKEKAVIPEKSRALAEETGRLKRELNQAVTEREAVQALEKAQAGLKKMEKSGVPEDLKKLGETLQQKKETERLGSTVAQADGKSLQEQIRELAKQMDKMDAGQLADLGELFQNAASQVSSEELAEALEGLSEALKNGQMPSVSMEELKKALQEGMKENQAYRNGIQAMNKKLAAVIGKAPGVPKSGEKEKNEPHEALDKEANQPGDGGGKDNGGAQKANGAQNGRGSGHTETEKVFTRQGEAMAGYDTNVEGAESGEGESTFSESRTMGEAGESKPYDAVYYEYKERAMQDMENTPVPYGMKQLVAEYFSTLEK